MHHTHRSSGNDSLHPISGASYATQSDRKALVRDASANSPASWLAKLVMIVFGVLLRPRLNSSRFGWQLVAIARRAGSPDCTQT